MCLVLRSAMKFRPRSSRYTIVFASSSMWYAYLYTVWFSKKTGIWITRVFLLSSCGQLIKIYWHRRFKFSSKGWTLPLLLRQSRWCVISWEIWRPILFTNLLKQKLTSPQDSNVILGIHHFTFFFGTLSNSYCLLWTQTTNHWST